MATKLQQALKKLEHNAGGATRFWISLAFIRDGKLMQFGEMEDFPHLDFAKVVQFQSQQMAESIDQRVPDKTSQSRL